MLLKSPLQERIGEEHVADFGRWECRGSGLFRSPPIFFSAPPMPSGLRVNCTAQASARYSRCRETAALIRSPKNDPDVAEDVQRRGPGAAICPPPSCDLLTSRRPSRIRNEPIMRDHQDAEEQSPISRMFSRMSPLRMWLNSWAMTPCSSSRFRYSSAPRVTPITASPGR